MREPDIAERLRGFSLAWAKVAAFFASHFKENVEPLGLEAFVGGGDREARAEYKRALDKPPSPEWSDTVCTANPADVVDRQTIAQWRRSGR